MSAGGTLPIKRGGALPVRSAWHHAVRSGAGGRGGVGGCGSCDGGCDPGADGVRPARGHGCGGGGHVVGRHGEAPACAGGGASAWGGGPLAPDVTTSSPSCDPWSSCCHWRWPPGGAKVQPSASVKTMVMSQI